MTETVVAQASNRHIHLSERAAEWLFGPSGHVPQRKRWLGIGDCYASDTSLTADAPQGMLRLRLLLPYREASQVELLESDCWFKPCFRDSGDVLGAPFVTAWFEGRPLWVSAIVARPHVHAPVGWRPGLNQLWVDVGQGDRLRAHSVCASVRRSSDCLEPVLHVNADEAERFGWPPREDVRVTI